MYRCAQTIFNDDFRYNKPVNSRGQNMINMFMTFTIYLVSWYRPVFKHKNTVIKEMHLQLYIIVIVYLPVYSIFKNGAV